MTAVLDSASDGLVNEENDTVIYSNHAYASQLGYRSTDLVGRPISDLIAPSDRDRLLTYGHQRIDGVTTPTRYLFRARHKEGRSVQVSATVSVALLNGTSLILTSIHKPGAETLRSDEIQRMENLTSREREVVTNILNGMTPKVMALKMGVSVKTIATFRARALSKLSIENTRDLFCFGLRSGLILP